MRPPLVALGLGLAFLGSVAAEPPQADGVLAGLSGAVRIERAGAPARPASLGERLRAGDAVVVPRDGSASVYLTGGGIVRLEGGARFETPSASGRDTAGTRLATASIHALETGLWILEAPEGSVLVSPMRGDEGGVPWSGPGALVLSPRYEALAGTAATFYWTGGPERARVAVARRREVVWRSAPAPPGHPVAGGPELTLAPGEVYTWWLESPTDGTPLTAGVPFRVLSKEALEAAAAFEKDLATADPGAAALLRCARELGAGSFTAALAAAIRLPEGAAARERAIEEAAHGLRLTGDDVAALARMIAR